MKHWTIEDLLTKQHDLEEKDNNLVNVLNNHYSKSKLENYGRVFKSLGNDFILANDIKRYAFGQDTINYIGELMIAKPIAYTDIVNMREYITYADIKILLIDDMNDEIIFTFHFDSFSDKSVSRAKELCKKISNKHHELLCYIEYDSELIIKSEYKSTSEIFSGDDLLNYLNSIKKILENEYIDDLKAL